MFRSIKKQQRRYDFPLSSLPRDTGFAHQLVSSKIFPFIRRSRLENIPTSGFYCARSNVMTEAETKVHVAQAGTTGGPCGLKGKGSSRLRICSTSVWRQPSATVVLLSLGSRVLSFQALSIVFRAYRTASDCFSKGVENINGLKRCGWASRR